MRASGGADPPSQRRDLRSRATCFLFDRRVGLLWTATRTRHRHRSTASQGEILSTDGPYAEAKEHLGGFYIINAEDLDAALALASKVTRVIGAPIEVRPFADFADEPKH